MKVKYSVTFEFNERPPVTHRGTVVGSRASICVRRATEQAQKALSPINWTSMVCVLLERVDTLDEAAVVSEPVPSVA